MNTNDSAGPRYGEIEVQLTGTDGNAGAIMGTVRRALAGAGVPREEQNEFTTECMSGDYDNLLRTCMRWVTVS